MNYGMNFILLHHMNTIIKNIKRLVQVEEKPAKWVQGENMSKVQFINDAYLKIKNGIIEEFGEMNDLNLTKNQESYEQIDAKNGMVFPSYCDSHTHLVFGETRENEFIDRVKGLTYQEIAKKGGGILNSCRSIQILSEDELYEKSLERINKLIRLGTGAIEIKSGYGLNIESEIKILKVIRRLKENTPITIKSTFLGAHAIPQEFKTSKEYLDLVINLMIPKIIEKDLIDFIDIFCEEGYFNLEDTKRILIIAKKLNIQSKIHLNQFNSLGGVNLATKYNALSVDHLEVMNDKDFKSLVNSETMPTLLPGCSFFLGIPYANAREFIKRGLPIAIASDYNPGSAPNGNMNFISSLSCIKMKLIPEEVINATTINTAYAMGLQNNLGSICVGKKANIFITKKIPSYNYLYYNYNENLIDKIILNGKIIK